MAPCCEKCRPLNSARMFRHPAPILHKQAVRAVLKEKNGSRVIEIGAGCLRNSLYLLKAGFKVSVLEVPGMEARFAEKFARFRVLGGAFIHHIPRKRTFELAVATFVVETICDKEERARILRNLCESLHHTGCLLISVRGPSDLVTAHERGRRCSDGYLTPGYTFARSYTRSQLQSLLIRSGFKNVEFFHRKGVKSPELLHAIAWRVNRG
jgi:hypothetical protein